ncbi:DUF167 domain-containing protein [Candidatus Woesearchaeota archaeon]|nr:DUF167 domain-containing protein [Candidatus Woesearchaeota archaeon]
MINLSPYIKDNKLKITVKPNSPKNQIKIEDNKVKLYIKAPPEKGKANKEVIKFFSKLLKKDIKIIAGLTSRQKLIRTGK